MMPAERNRWILILQKFVFFVLFYELKKTFVTPLVFKFLFTNKRAVLLSAQTDQSQFSFPVGFRHEIELALTVTGFWHQKNLAP